MEILKKIHHGNIKRWTVTTIILALVYVVLIAVSFTFSNHSCNANTDFTILENAYRYQECISNVVKKYDFQDMHQTRDLLLNYKIVTDSINNREIQFSSSLTHLLGAKHTIEKSRLFDWYLPGLTIHHLARKFVGRGIVISAYDKWFPTAYFAVAHIRNYHKSDIPIYIFHNGTELSAKNIGLIKQFANVTVHDLQNYFDDTKVSFSGYATKAAVILAAPCQECIFLDCDAWFFQNPSVLFEQKGYIDTGLLLFKDRTKDGGTKGMEWVKKLVPKKSLHAIEHLRIYQGKTYHEAESGMVVIDKKKRFLNILAIAYMNENTIVPQSHKDFHGDKETFWIGSAMINQPFSFNDHLPFTVGNYDPKYKPGEFCSTQMAHGDGQGKLLWVHGGVTKNKYDMNSELQSFNHWSPEVGEYQWYGDLGLICMKMEKHKTHSFTASEKLVFHQAELIWKNLTNLFE